MNARPSSWGLIALMAVVVGGGAVVTGPGCASEPSPFQIPPTGSGSGGGGGAGGAGHRGEEMFRELETDFVEACGSCHAIGGIADSPFLGDPASGDPDPYEACTSWPGIVVSKPSNSVLITWPASGSHSGGETDGELESRLSAWLEEEAKGVAEVGGEEPVIPPFKPIVPGFNAVYLDPLGPEFTGMAVTFHAEELTEGSLSLTGIEVHPTAALGLTFEHPLFTTYAPGDTDGEPDPVDSFSNVSQTIDAAAVEPLGPGTVVLTNWVPGGKLSLAFETIAVVDPMGGGGGAGGGTTGPCAAVPSFQTNAVPELGPCGNCHDGSNQTATNALDMTDVGVDDAAACGQVLNRVSLTDPPQSQLFITTDPNGTAGHPFKFNGNAGDHDSFVQNVTIWIDAEAQAQ